MAPPSHDDRTEAGGGTAGQAAAARATSLFLDDRNLYGCAETSLKVLREAFDLPDRDSSGSAMALNGGIAYTGATCGAITGCAIALGELAALRVRDHPSAKRVARGLTLDLVTSFEAEFGATDCRTLIGRSIRTPEEHRAFIEGGVWRDRCLRQVAFAVRRMAPLASGPAWSRAVASLEEDD